MWNNFAKTCMNMQLSEIEFDTEICPNNKVI